MKTAYLLFAGVLLAACSTPPATTLTPVPIEDVKAKIAAKPLIVFSSGRFKGNARFHPDGKLEGDFGWAKDNGTWWVENEAVCIKFDRAIWGQKRCGQIYPAQGVYYDVMEPGSAVKRGQISFAGG